MMENGVTKTKKLSTGMKGLWFVLYSLVGVFMFFTPITIGPKTTIPIDHIVTFIRSIPNYTPIFGTIIVTIGGLYPFFKKTWNKSVVNTVFSILGLLGIVFVYMVVF